MPTQYRLSFTDQLVYDLEFVRTEVPDVVIRGVVYRVHGEQRESEPMQHADGRPMEFHGPTEHATMALACDVLQSVLERHIGSIVKCDPSQESDPNPLRSVRGHMNRTTCRTSTTR